jgi:hypothetical protein
MAKATQKSSRRRLVALAPRDFNFTLGSPVFDKPVLTQRHNLRAEPFDLQQEPPGDSPAERRARKFLRRLMQKYPAGLPGRSKPDFARVCQQRFGTPGRTFDRLWDWAIDWTAATQYRKSGPRGPHTSSK